MSYLAEVGPEELIGLILIFFRILGVFIMLPVLGDIAVPSVTKVGLAGFTAILICPVVPVSISTVDALHITDLVMLIIREGLIGVVIGAVVYFIFIAVQVAGQQVGFQMGLWLAQVFDPRFGMQTPVISQMQFLFAMLIFLLLNGHHILLKGVKESFVLIPLGGASSLGSFCFGGVVWKEVLMLGGKIFKIGFELGAPITGIMLMIAVAMGLMARVIPEMNVLMVAIPIRIGIGIFLLAITLPLVAFMLKQYFVGMGNDVFSLIRLMGK